jgi:hypothetical protein
MIEISNEQKNNFLKIFSHNKIYCFDLFLGEICKTLGIDLLEAENHNKVTIALYITSLMTLVFLSFAYHIYREFSFLPFVLINIFYRFIPLFKAQQGNGNAAGLKTKLQDVRDGAEAFKEEVETRFSSLKVILGGVFGDVAQYKNIILINQILCFIFLYYPLIIFHNLFLAFTLSLFVMSDIEGKDLAFLNQIKEMLVGLFSISFKGLSSKFNGLSSTMEKTNKEAKQEGIKMDQRAPIFMDHENQYDIAQRRN